MRKYLDPLTKQGTWNSHLPTIVFLSLSLLSLTAVMYITAVDMRYLLTHLNHLAAPGLTDEMRIHLEWEVAAEAVKVFLDIYLSGVVLLIIVPGLYTLVTKKDLFGIANGLELAAQMFLSRVEDLTKWLAGLILLRWIIRLLQKALRLELGDGADLVFILVISALLFSRSQVIRR